MIQMVIYQFYKKSSGLAFFFFFVAALMSAQQAFCTCKIEVGADRQIKINGSVATRTEQESLYVPFVNKDMTLNLYLNGEYKGSAPSRLEIINPHGKVVFSPDYTGSHFSCTATHLENSGTIKATGNSFLDLTGDFLNDGTASFKNLTIKQIGNIINNNEIEFYDSTFSCLDIRNTKRFTVQNTHVTFADLNNVGWVIANDPLKIKLLGWVTQLGQISVAGDVTFELSEDIDPKRLYDHQIIANNIKVIVNGKTIFEDSLDQFKARNNQSGYRAGPDAHNDYDAYFAKLRQNRSSKKKKAEKIQPVKAALEVFATVSERYQKLARQSVQQFLKDPTLEKLHDILSRSVREHVIKHEYRKDYRDQRIKNEFYYPSGYCSPVDGQFYLVEFKLDDSDIGGGEQTPVVDETEGYVIHRPQYQDLFRGREPLVYLNDLLWEFIFFKHENSLDVRIDDYISHIEDIQVKPKGADTICLNLTHLNKHYSRRGDFVKQEKQNRYINITFKKSHPFLFRPIFEQFNESHQRASEQAYLEKKDPSKVKFTFGESKHLRFYKCSFSDISKGPQDRTKSYHEELEFAHQSGASYQYHHYVEESDERGEAVPNTKQILAKLGIQVLNLTQSRRK